MTKKILTLTMGALMAAAPCVMAQETVSIEDNFTISPAPGQLSYDTMKNGLTQISFSPKSGITPAQNEALTENAELLLNGEVLSTIGPENMHVSYIDWHGGMWSISLSLNPDGLPAENFKQDGTYTVKVPEGLMLVDGIPTAATEWSYTYAGPVEGDIDFSSHIGYTEGDSFYSMSVYFDNTNLDISTTDDFKCDMIYDGEVVYTFKKGNTSAWGGNNYSINIPDDVRLAAKPGVYTFKVYPGSVKALDKADMVYATNTETQEYEYTLIAKPAVESTTPESGSTVSELSEVTVGFNRFIAVVDNSWATPVQVKKDGVALDNKVELATVEEAYQGKVVKVTITPAITEAGEYTIENVANFLMYKLRSDDTYGNYWSNNGQIELKYTVDANAGLASIEENFTLSPAPGSSLSYNLMKGGFTQISFSPKSGVTPAENPDCTGNAEMYLNGELLSSVGPENMHVNYIDWHGGFWSIYLNMNPDGQDAEKFKQAGTYTVKVPEGLMLVNGAPTAAAEWTYTYAGLQEGDIDFASRLSLADGDTFYSMSIKFENSNLDVSITDDFKCEMIYDGEVAYTFKKDNTSAWGGNNYNINIPDDVRMEAKPGVYTFKVYPGSVKAVDTADMIYAIDNEAQEYEYTLIAKPALEKVSPENGSAVEELSEITLTFNRLMAAYDNTWATPIQITKDDVVLDNYKVEVSTEAAPYEGNEIKVTITPAITEEGEYVILNLGSFIQFKLRESDSWPTYWSYDNPITLVYSVANNSGIFSLSADGKYDVYNTQGVRILRSADREAVSNLQRGIYVINGKKVIIK